MCIRDRGFCLFNFCIRILFTQYIQFLSWTVLSEIGGVKLIAPQIGIIVVKIKNVQRLCLENIRKLPQFFTTMHGLDMNFLGTCNCSHPLCVTSLCTLYTHRRQSHLRAWLARAEGLTMYTHYPTELTHSFHINLNFPPFLEKPKKSRIS